MPKLRIVIQHTIEQVVLIGIPRDELEIMTYNDALANCPFDDYLPTLTELDVEIVNATVDGHEHFFK